MTIDFQILILLESSENTFVKPETIPTEQIH